MTDVCDKIECQTPTPDKKPTRIAKWKYDAVRRAIRKVVPRNKSGVPFRDLPKLVKNTLPAETLARLGSVSWYVTTVKLHLEVIGELERVPDSKPQRLRLVSRSKPKSTVS